jgi:antitoxin HicB
MKYHFKVHKEGKGFWAECIELDGCITQGENREHLREMMEEALAAYLDEAPDSKHVFPMPNPGLKGRNIVAVPLDPTVAMAMTVRQARIRNKMTQKQAAEKMGMKHVYQYQKLETGKYANPELMTLARLKTVFPGLSIDAVLA